MKKKKPTKSSKLQTSKEDEASLERALHSVPQADVDDFLKFLDCDLERFKEVVRICAGEYMAMLRPDKAINVRDTEIMLKVVDDKRLNEREKLYIIWKVSGWASICLFQSFMRNPESGPGVKPEIA